MTWSVILTPAMCFDHYTGTDGLEYDSDPHCVCFCRYTGAETFSVVLTTIQELMTWSVILTPTVCVFANCMTRKMCFAHLCKSE